MLLITYGLRAGEVSGLQLDDLDWKRETLHVRCRKTGRTHLYPLSRGVGCMHPPKAAGVGRPALGGERVLGRIGLGREPAYAA